MRSQRKTGVKRDLPALLALAAGAVLLLSCLLLGKTLLKNEDASPAVYAAALITSQSASAAQEAVTSQPSTDAAIEPDPDLNAPSVFNYVETPTQAAPAETVYVTVSGTKYHRADCSYLHATRITMPLDQAIEEGYTPCSRCNP